MPSQKPEATATATPTPRRRGKGGRPKLPAGTVRSRVYGVRVNPDQDKLLTEKAAALGMKPGPFLLEAGISRRLPSPPVPAINRAEYAELARLAANLNQIARAANEGRVVVADIELLTELTNEVSRLRLALMGVDEK